MSELILDWFRKWLAEHEESRLIYKIAAEKQVMFIRDDVPHAFGRWPALRASDRVKVDERCADITVVGEHHSKSVRLPVYRIAVTPWLTVYARGNFHDWKLSVDASSPVVGLRHTGLFDPELDDLLHPCYFEGFEEAEAPIFPNYATNNQRFSLRLPYHEGTVFAFFRELWLATSTSRPRTSC